MPSLDANAKVMYRRCNSSKGSRQSANGGLYGQRNSSLSRPDTRLDASSDSAKCQFCDRRKLHYARPQAGSPLSALVRGSGKKRLAETCPLGRQIARSVANVFLRRKEYSGPTPRLRCVRASDWDHQTVCRRNAVQLGMFALDTRLNAHGSALLDKLSHSETHGSRAPSVVATVILERRAASPCGGAQARNRK
jgi:hypothetical protein